MLLFRRYNLAQITGIQTVLSDEMLNKLDLWNNILQGKAEWNAEALTCGVVDCTIGELAKPVSEEIEVNTDNERLAIPMKKLNECSHELVQNIVAIGGSVVRPIYANGKMQFEIVKLGNYIPTSYDIDGTLTGCIITKKLNDDKKEFILIERHNYKNKTHSVLLELYKINGQSLYKVDLSACTQTAELTPFYSYENVEMPFIVEVKNRMPNKIDGSNVPCALWQNTENLIKDADEQYSRILWEQEGGELRVFADEDLFKKKQGAEFKKVDPKLNKLIVKLNGNGIDAERITEHSPTLRTAQQVEAFNEILRRCELAWNIGKGTLSDLANVSQTATQYTGGKKALYSMVDSIESELEEKYKHLAYIFAYMISAYENVPFDDRIEIVYNDAARKDPTQMKQLALQELQNGIISAAEYRMMFFGEDEQTANAKVPEQTNTNDFGGQFRFE